MSHILRPRSYNVHRLALLTLTVGLLCWSPARQPSSPGRQSAPAKDAGAPAPNPTDRTALESTLWGQTLARSAAPSASDEPTRARVGAAYGKLPLSFETNRGQFAGEVEYFSRGIGYNLFLTRTEAVLALRAAGAADKNASPGGRAGEEARTVKPAQDVVRLKLGGANPAPSIKAVDELPGKSNYFIGDDPAKWRTGVSHYARVRYENVYPGVSLIYFGNQRRLEYDFVVAPGANPGVIRLVFGGARDLYVDEGGDLILRTEGGGELRQHKPLIYQEVGGERKEVAGGYVLRGGREVGFEVAEYDAARPLVIDPVLSYSTYLGGAGADTAYDIAVDSSGNAYVTGATKSTNFPVANSLPHGDRDGMSEDVFVTKLNAAGSALVYSTYLGGNGNNREDRARAVAVDATGNAYVAGYTGSSSFPTVNAFQPALRGSYDGFVAKLNPSGSALVYSTFLGGSDSNEEIRGIAVDSAGGTYVAGYTRSTDFPMVNALRATHGGGSDDGFVAKLSPSGSALVYSTYLGGHSYDYGNSVAVDSTGSAYVTGLTYSSNFPLANPLQPACGCFLGTCAGDGDIFITKLNPAGSAFVYSTFLGGHGVEEGRDIAVDSSGSAYITGATGSGNFPTVNPFQSTLSGGSAFCNSSDAFVTKLNPEGSALVYSTFLGGFQGDGGNSIAVDSAGSAYVAGSTGATNFPTVNASQPAIGGAEDVFVTKLNPAGSALVFSTYLGGTTTDVGYGIGIDPVGNAYVTGYTFGNFPTERPFQPVFGGGNFNTNESLDAFVAKIGDTALPAALSISAVTPNHGGNNGSVSVTIHGSGFASGATVKLVRMSQPDIPALVTVISEQGTVARTRFDLSGKEPGEWSVVVTNLDGSVITHTDGFTIEAGGGPQIWVDIVGRERLRPGRPQTYYIYYGNRGNAEAYGVPLWIRGIPRDAQLDLGFEIPPPPQFDEQAPIDYSQVPAIIETDTEKVLPLYIPVVRVGQSVPLKITLTVPTARDFELQVYTYPPQYYPNGNQNAAAMQCGEYDSKSSASSTSGPALLGCFNSLLGTGLNLVGVFSPISISCFASLGLTAASAIQGTYAGATDDSINTVLSGVQVNVGITGSILTCAREAVPLQRVRSAVNTALSIPSLTTTGCPVIGAAISKVVGSVFSLDPNDKVGSQGSGSSHYLSGEEPLRYAVYFENVASATAPAQDVVITDQLDASKLDFDTFSLGPIAFGKDWQVVPPPGLSEFKKDVDLRPANDLIVRVEARLDKATGLLTWRFTSIDPATGQPTEDPTAGFLPPNLIAPEGEGQVLFTVRPKEGVATGAEIRNRARIVFDSNAPIDTPEWLNTIDNSKPSSRVQALAAQQDSSRFEVSWSGEDAGSGLHSYTVFASENGGPFYEWRRDTTAHSAFFTGQPGRSYAFYSVARDAVGNYEDAPGGADASTATRPLVLQLSASSYAVGEGGGKVIVTVVRSGNVDEASVGYATGNGTASDRSDYTAALGTLRFAAGETSKSFNVLVTDDALVEGVETLNVTLSDPAGGATLGGQSTATITITDNDSTPSGFNPIGDSQFFVRQHYADFLNREPDASGLQFWTNEIEQCGSDAQCREVKRIHVSAAFFLSIEFQNTGYLAYRTYKAAFGDATSPNVEGTVPVIRLNEFLSDSQRIGQGVQVNVGDWERRLEANKDAYALEFVTRQRFADAYPATMTPAQFVDRLDENAGGVLSQEERDQLIAELAAAANATQEGRAKALRKVAEDADLRRGENNRAFVLMQFYGYLRRNPDDPQDTDFRGWKFWLDKLNQFDGDFIRAEMVKAFLDSDEYRRRFGQ